MTFEPTAYIATFAIMRDEYTFEQTVRFVTSRDPALFMRAILESWYDNRDAQQHLPGQITFERADIAVDDTATIRPIRLDTFDELDGIVANVGDERAAWGGLVEKGGAR